MSVSEAKEDSNKGLDIDELVEANPNVDAAKLREAFDFLARLRREGLSGPEYEIASPRERRPLSRDDRQGVRRQT